MAGIYQRDNINYGGMLGNAMRERANQIQRDYENYMKQPQAWANAIQNSGQIVQNAFNQAAQYQYNKDQLANQQQFQSEQNALNRAQQLQLAREQQAEALRRAQEQQKWQAEQNRLQRESTERIAGMSRADGLEERTAQNIMNYNNAEAVFNQYQSEFDNTDPSTADGIMKRAKLQSLMEQERNKMKYYEGKIPVEFRPKPEGTPVITGEDAEKALAMFDSEQPADSKKAYEVAQDANEFKTLLDSKTKWTNANKQRAMELANTEADRQMIANRGLTVEEAKAARESELANARAEFARSGTYDSTKYKIKYSNSKATLVRK